MSLKALLAVEDWGKTVLRSIRSKTVITAGSGFAVHYCVRRGYIPDTFFSQALEGVAYVLCALFRVAAVSDLKTGGSLQ